MQKIITHGMVNQMKHIKRIIYLASIKLETTELLKEPINGVTFDQLI